MLVYDYYKEKETRKKKVNYSVFVIAVVIAVALSMLAGIYIEYIQFREIGDYTSVFTTNLQTKIIFSLIVFIFVFSTIFITNNIIKKNYLEYFKNDEMVKKNILNWPIAILIGVVTALFTKDAFYEKALMFLNNVNFNKTIPLFDKDAGYFIFTRPFLMTLYDFVSFFWVIVIIYTFVYYLILAGSSLAQLASGNINFENFKIRPFLKHSLINIAIFFLIKIFSFKFQKEGILYNEFAGGTEPGFKGAGFIDVNIWLNFYTIAPFLVILIVGISFFFISKGKLKNALYTICVYPGTFFLVTIVAAFVQSFFVERSIVDYEGQYIKHNINMTRAAYNLDKIKVEEFGNIKELTPEVLNRNLDTKDNIRIIDYASTLDSNKQLQAITNFYTFKDGDIVNYNKDGKNIPVFIAAREVDKTQLANNTYLSRKFKYTHGYGVAINPINKVKAQGQVDFIISDLPDNKAKINQPSIYYGEATSDYVLVNAKGINEFTYDGNEEVRYQGKGGIPLTFFTRLMFALKYGDTDMLLSNYVDKDTKILLNRQILERAKKVLPFLDIDSDPFVIIGDDGKLKWVIDAYTTTSNYPYAENVYIPEYGNVNYIRNSVKIVIDAYDGTMKCYIVDKTDPIINVYKKIYPSVFTDEPLPEDVKNYMKYPELLFKIQTDILKKYHLNAEEVNRFFSGSDMWAISRHFSETANSEMLDIDPFYNMVKLPSGVGKEEEFILMRPFSPSGRDKHNMVSWLAVRNSVANYGEMVLFKFSKNTNVLGPYQVAVKINQNEEISTAMTLLGQKGSSAYKGNLMVIPIEESILYVEPIYVRASVKGSIPEIKKIFVGYQKNDELMFGIGANLEAAISDMFKRTQNLLNDKQTQNTTNGANNASNQTSVAYTVSENGTTSNKDILPNAPTNNVQNGNISPTDEKKTREQLLTELGSKYDNVKSQIDEIGKMIDMLKKTN